jgi:hypothetical protein
MGLKAHQMDVETLARGINKSEDCTREREKDVSPGITWT